MDSLPLGAAVQVNGLESDSGRQLNGRRGVITRVVDESGRCQVRFSTNRSAAVRPQNLTRVQNLPSDSVLLHGVEGIDPDAQSPCIHQELLFHKGDVVETFGLHSEVGQELNGKNGIILKYIDETDRFEVRFALGMVGNRYEYKVVHLKASQMVKINKNPLHNRKKKTDDPPRQGISPNKDQPASYMGDYQVGDMVEVHGLTSDLGRPLNGRTGEIWAFVAEKQRYEVKFMPEAELRSLKALNLRRAFPDVSNVAPAAGYV